MSPKCHIWQWLQEICSKRCSAAVVLMRDSSSFWLVEGFHSAELLWWAVTCSKYLERRFSKVATGLSYVRVCCHSLCKRL